MTGWYMPKPAIGVVAEQITKFVDERDYVSSIEMAHWILNALLEHGYVHAEWPADHDPVTGSAWVTPLDSVHCACLGDPGTATAHVCNAPLGETIYGDTVDIHWDVALQEHVRTQ